MSQPLAPTPPPAQTFREFLRTFRVGFRPASLAALRDLPGSSLQREITAGLVVGVVALPLAIAFAIASGAPPKAGLITAALAGIVAALFGGSRVNVTGPTGAFVVILYAITSEFGLEKLFVATLMAGALLFLFGLFRLGNLIKFIPYPVTTGFTAGIAVIIFLGQVPHLLGLGLDSVPAEAPQAVRVIAANLDRVGLQAVLIALGTIAVIQVVKRLTPRVPGPAVALLVFTLVAYLVPGLGVQTVGDRFSIPSGLPSPRVPDLGWGVIVEMFPAALTIALLGAIESLLSCVVSDGMAGTTHDSNQELMGQGIANLFVPFFGGIAATGAIARTATNVQMGGRTPLAAVVHGVVVLAVLVAAAPLVAHVPMAVLAGILAVVAWNMSERHRFRQLLRMPVADAGVMLATFALTVLVGLTVAVQAGMILAAAFFLYRMSNATTVDLIHPGSDPRYRQRAMEGRDVPEGCLVYSIDGPFFFGAADRFREAVSRVGARPKVVVFRMRHVPYLDATGLNSLETVVQQLRKQGTHVVLSAVQNQPLDMMMRAGFLGNFDERDIRTNIDSALDRARELLGVPPAAPPAPASPSSASPVASAGGSPRGE